MANVPIPILPAAISLDGTEQIEIVQPAGSGGTSKRTTVQAIANKFANNFSAEIPILIDGGNTTILTGFKGYMRVPFAATITSAELLSDMLGSIVVDIWKCNYAQFDGGVTHPVAGDSITGGNPPTIANDHKSLDAVLNGWSVTLAAGDVLAFNVNSVVNMARVTLTLNLSRAAA